MYFYRVPYPVIFKTPHPYQSTHSWNPVEAQNNIFFGSGTISLWFHCQFTHCLSFDLDRQVTKVSNNITGVRLQGDISKFFVWLPAAATAAVMMSLFLVAVRGAAFCQSSTRRRRMDTVRVFVAVTSSTVIPSD